MENYPKPVSKDCIKVILKQMDNLFYKKYEKEGNYLTVFFCNIKYKSQKIPVLIANSIIINEIVDNSINISINDNKMKLELGDIIYRYEYYDIAIVEIKENQINDIIYLEIDDIIYNKEAEIFFPGESIYIIHYNKEKKIF